MKKIIVLIVIVLNTTLAFATNQYKDLLVINNDTFEINSPIDLISDSAFERLWYNKITNRNYINSGCWRGAICTWMVKNDSLFLIKAESCYDKRVLDLDILDKKNKVIFAKWISGVIEYPSGRILCLNIFDKDKIFDESTNGYLFEFDNSITVNNGRVKIEQYDNRMTKCGRFKDIEEINSDIESLLNLFMRIDNDIDFSIYSYISNDGHLINTELFGLKDSTLKNDIINALNKEDGLPVYYKKGKLLNNRIEGDFRIINNTR